MNGGSAEVGSEVLVMWQLRFECHDDESGSAHVRDRARYRGCGSAGKADYNLNPFPFPGIPSVRPSGPSVVRPAAESAPGVARTRPMAPRDRESIRKVAISGLDCRFGRPRPSGLDGGCPASSRLQACPAGEPWHQFVRSGCHAGHGVLS